MGQLVFGRDTIILIKHNVDSELICQKMQTQIVNIISAKYIKRADHGYEVGDKVILTNNNSYIYETPYNGPFLITQYWKNSMVTLQCGLIKIRHNIRRINPYKYHTNIEYINPENMCDDVSI